MERDDSEGRFKATKNTWEGTGGRKYIERTRGIKPRKILVRLVEKLEPGKAVELGIGAGNETRFLLENGWKVLAVDINEECRNSVNSVLNEELKENFSFLKRKFENLKLEKESCDLIVAFDSLHFCNKEHFNEFFKTVLDAIKPNGYFIGNFLGIRDTWKETRGNYMPFFTKEEILELFSGFEIDEKGLIESERDGKTTVSFNPKHWHTFFVRAKKK